jgi:hemerythrin
MSNAPLAGAMCRGLNHSQWGPTLSERHSMVRALYWIENWTTGDPEMDEVHKGLIALANAIRGDDTQKADVIALIDSYAQHLSAEERLIRRTHASAADKIREEMASDLYLLRQMADSIDLSEDSDRDIAVSIILGIVTEHIRGQAHQGSSSAD